MHHFLRKSVIVLLICTIPLLLGGCSKGPEATVKSFWKAMLDGNSSRAASYTDGSTIVSSLASQAAWGGATYQDKRLFFKYCSSSMLESSDSSAKVRWSMDFRGMMAETGETIQSFGFTNDEAAKVLRYLDAMSIVDFTLKKQDTKWKITFIDMPDLMRIIPELDLDLLKRMERMQ